MKGCLKQGIAKGPKVAKHRQRIIQNTLDLTALSTKDFASAYDPAQSPLLYRITLENNKDLAYGYAAVSIARGTGTSWCCACFELTFTSEPVSGKRVIVQAINTGEDLTTNQFDLVV